MRALPALPLVLVLVAALGCPAPDVPGPEVGAAYMGLSEGKVFTYQTSDGLEETVTVTENNGFTLGDRIVYDLVARAQTNLVVDERTLSLAVGADSVELVRFFDCISKCATLSAPVPFLQLPLEGGQSDETEVVVAKQEQGQDAGQETQRHAILVDDAADITVPAGTFEAFTVSWTRTIDDGTNPATTENATLRIAEGEGIVAWTSFDGTELQLK
jgi:hypothetical protein